MKHLGIEQDVLHDLFDYDGKHLINRTTRGSRALKGIRAGCVDKSKGYVRVRVNKVLYSEHILVWIYHNGEYSDTYEIDHINGVRDDNRIENLRLCTSSENHFNNHVAKGVYYSKRNNNYYSQIQAYGKRRCLGTFDSSEDARIAYLKAKEELHEIGSCFE